MSRPSEPAAAQPVSGYDLRWQPHNRKRQAMILQAATELLEEDADFSMQEVARRSGLAKSVMYRQFNGREDLDRRLRSKLIDDFAATVATNLDIADGTLQEILTRTIRGVAAWMSDHPRLSEFARTGPTHDVPGMDAVSNLKLRVTRQARDLIAEFAQAVGVDAQAYSALPFAVVTMVEGTLREWVREPAETTSRDDIVSQLSDYAWYMLDGVARATGLDIDPARPITETIDQLARQRQAGPSR